MQLFAFPLRRLPAGRLCGLWLLSLSGLASAQNGQQANRPVLVSPQFGPLGGTRSPIAPFAHTPNNGPNRRNINDNEVHYYTSPLSPFATYRASYNPYFSRYNRTDFRYSNGLYGNGTFVYNWAGNYFDGGLSYYPYYVPNYSFGLTYYSPYSFYYQVTPAFIAADFAYVAPPQIIYVPVPVYVNGAYNGNRRDDLDDYYLNREPRDTTPSAKKNDPQDNKPGDTPSGKSDGTEKKSDAGAGGYKIGEGKDGKDDKIAGSTDTAKPKERAIDTAAAEIAKAWRERDIQLFSKYIDAKAKVAVYLRGRYQYSLENHDYLDITRDAFQATKTVKFEFDAPVYKERGVYLLNGRHTYQAKDGTEHTIHINYVLELKEDKYVITQVGSAPDRVEE